MADEGVGTPRRDCVAVLYADAHGFSRHMARDEAGTLIRVERTLAFLHDMIVTHGGWGGDTAGDSIFAAFRRADQALGCAVAFQRALLNAEARSPPGTALRFRVGLHRGEALIINGRIRGYQVAVSERLQRLAPPGGIYASEALLAAVEKPPPAVAWQFLGVRTLPNIDEQIEVYAVDFGGPDSTAPSPDMHVATRAQAARNASQHRADVIAIIKAMRIPADGWRLLAATDAGLRTGDATRRPMGELLGVHPGFRLTGWRRWQPYPDARALGLHEIEGLRHAGLPRE